MRYLPALLLRWTPAALAAVLLSAWIGLPAFAIGAQKRVGQCRLDVWGAREGLPGYDITALAQTPDGYIWVGTTAGLFRFDGQTFTRFDRSTVKGLSSNLIRSLLVTRAGRLWVGTEWGGFGRLNGNRFVRVDSTSQWNCTYSLHQAADGSILAGYMSQSGKQLACVKDSTLSMIPLTTGIFSTGFADRRDGSTVTSVLYDGLRVLRNGALKPYPLVHPLPNTDVRCMIQRADGSIVVGTDFGGVYVIKGNRWAHYSHRQGISSNAVTCLYEDGAHRLLIGTNNGLDVWTSSGIEHIGPADGLGDYHIDAILEDREGNLWVATGKKLNRFADTALTAVDVRAGKQPVINMSAPSVDGGVLCATRDGLFAQPSNTVLPSKQLLTQGMEGVTQIAGGDLVTWNYHPGPVLHYDVRREHNGAWTVLGQVRFSVQNLVSSNPLTVLGTNGELQTVGSNVTLHLLQKFNNPHVFASTMDPTGTLWLGTEAGLIRVRENIAIAENDGVAKGAHVLSVDATDPRCLWLGTDKGLARTEVDETGDCSSTMYGTHDGLPDDDLLQVACDNRGYVWVGGYFGIFSAAKSAIADYHAGKIASIPSTLYTTADGVRSYPMLNSPVHGRDGRLWFVGQDGLTMVDPDKLITNPTAPPVLIDTAAVDGVSIGSSRRNVMQPGRGTFTVKFAALSFNAPEKVRYRYRLVGYDAHWVEAGWQQHAASYTNLPPGVYRFEVTACNNEGVWAPAPVAIDFTIRPHFYQKTSFAVLCVLGGMGLIGLMIWWRTRQMSLRARELEHKVATRTAELAAANAEVTQSHSRLSERNVELQEMQAELEAQNQELLETQSTLAAANERLQTLATTDGLTGLMNHRSFQERLETEWIRHKREGDPLSLILLDVDNFKSYNDTYGHPAGDEVLRSVAQVLREVARDSDIVGRYGGEEFTVIAPSTDSVGAEALAERLRAALERGQWPLRAVTASFGVSTTSPTHPAGGPSPAALIANADLALYRSKHGGRNRVTSFESVDGVGVVDKAA